MRSLVFHIVPSTGVLHRHGFGGLFPPFVSYVEIFVSSTRVLPLLLPMAQMRWQEKVGGVFLCGDCDVRFGVSINFPPLYGSASSAGT